MDITIWYQLNIASIPDVVAKTVSEFLDSGMNSNNYIIYDNAFYWFNPVAISK